MPAQAGRTLRSAERAPAGSMEVVTFGPGNLRNRPATLWPNSQRVSGHDWLRRHRA
jgi:hypothetical protein